MTNAQVDIIKYIAAEALVEGDIVKLNTVGKAAKVAAVEATDAIGVVYADANSGDAVGIVIRGMTTVRFLIEDTDGAAGYDKAIVRGDLLIISGKAAGTYVVGQALSAVGGTAQATAVSGMVVGKALEADAGSIAGDTYGTMKAYVNFVC